MKIGVDGRLLHRRMSGLERYMSQVVKALDQLGMGHDGVLFTSAPKLARISATAFKEVLCGSPASFLDRISREQLDLYHLTWLGNALSDYLPLLTTPVSVVTVPDLILYSHPEYAPRDLHRDYQAFLRCCLPWANQIIVFSQHTRSELKERLDLPEDRIHVTPLAIDQRFLTTQFSDDAKSWLKARHGLPKDFLLYLGKDYPHKNLAALVEAFCLARGELQMPLGLVLAGESVWPGMRERLLAICKTHGLAEALFFVDHFPDEELPLLYSSAMGFVYPSLYEGFGLPPLEAMAVGTPVLAVAETSVPEVVGDAALLVEAGEVVDLAKGIIDLVSDGDLRRMLGERGRQRAAQFTWIRTAKATLEAYERATNSGGPIGDRDFPTRLLVELPGCLPQMRMVRAKLQSGSRAHTSVPMRKQCTPKTLMVYPGISGVGFDSFGKGMDQSWISHGLCSIASAARLAGYPVDLIDLRLLKGWDHFTEVIAMERPDVVGLSMMSVDYNPAMRCIEIIKKANPATLVVVGGPHPSLMPDDLLQNVGIDVIVQGEGEITFVDILRAVERGEKPSRLIQGVPPELDELPYPDHDLFGGLEYPLPIENLKTPFVTIIAGRGCKYSCSLCQPAEQRIFGLSVRRRSVRHVMGELEELRRKYRFNSLMIHDDCLTEDREWVLEFCKQYKDRGFTQPFVCHSRADIICQNEDIVEAMASVGLAMMIVGFESGSNRILRFLRKGVKVEQNIRAAEILRRHGVKIWADYMLGIPTETRDEVLETVQLIRQIQPDVCNPAFYTPYPGSDLFDYVNEHGLSLINNHDQYRRNPTEAEIRGVDCDFLKVAFLDSTRRVDDLDEDDPRVAIMKLRYELAKARGEVEADRSGPAIGITLAEKTVALQQEHIAQLEQHISALERHVARLSEHLLF